MIAPDTRGVPIKPAGAVQRAVARVAMPKPHHLPARTRPELAQDRCRVDEGGSGAHVILEKEDPRVVGGEERTQGDRDAQRVAHVLARLSQAWSAHIAAGLEAWVQAVGRSQCTDARLFGEPPRCVRRAKSCWHVRQVQQLRSLPSTILLAVEGVNHAVVRGLQAKCGFQQTLHVHPAVAGAPKAQYSDMPESLYQ
eukprot:scaffold22088_cov114-Isochrysis_galbana.AAC.7